MKCISDTYTMYALVVECISVIVNTAKNIAQNNNIMKFHCLVVKSCMTTKGHHRPPALERLKVYTYSRFRISCPICTLQPLA